MITNVGGLYLKPPSRKCPQPEKSKLSKPNDSEYIYIYVQNNYK